MLDEMQDFLKNRSPRGARFWQFFDGFVGDVPLQDHADIIYCAFLLNDHELINDLSAQSFSDYLKELPLYGKERYRDNNSRAVINAHLTAYLLGALRLLETMGKAKASDAFYQRWRKDLLLDHSNLPRWPWIWSHHIWRVSHWIGGSTSILLHLARCGHVPWATEQLVNQALQACEERILDTRSGLLKPYRSTFLQALFRKLYARRHDPALSDLGGVVHLLWVYHAIGRPYPAREQLLRAASRELRRLPFMEDVPYCLDFDILQLARTASSSEYASLLAERAARFIEDTLAFLSGNVPDDYALHKLPGALASLHECAYMLNEPTIRGLGINRTDVIEQAFWL